MAYFDAEGTHLVKAEKPTKMLLCFAAPLQEPMVSHGPFVMNTTTEIMEAMRDYQMGKMGVLTD
jgi:redox-sensitive bicupin YhaK (pirin superfamily)